MSELLDITDITVNRPMGPKILPETVPERAEGISDFQYGDKREALASQSEHVFQLFDYCYGGSIDILTWDWTCWQPFDSHFISMFGAYGVNGTIKMGNGTRSTANLVQVPFCQITPNGLQGLEVNTSKLALQAARVPCPARRRREQQVVISKEQQEAQSQVRPFHIREQMERLRAAGKLPPLPEQHMAEGKHNERSMRSLLAALNITVPDFTVDHWTVGVQCAEHKDCKQGKTQIFEGFPLAKSRFWSNTAGSFCASDNQCDVCVQCQDNAKAVDGTCPQDLCPGSGDFPECISAEKLMEDFTCPDKYTFQVRKFFNDTPSVAFPANVKMRFLTPFNRLVGSVLVSQSRKAKTSCVAGEGTANPGVLKPSIIEYINKSGSASTCLGDDADTAAYGVDSVLVPTSSIYDGKAMFGAAYDMSERADLNNLNAGYGFFNHSYDTILTQLKDPTLISGDFADAFNVYFDSRSTHSQASNYVTYLREGGFIDDQTETLKVQFVTFNIDSNVFAHLEFDFEFLKGGAIVWDWTMRTLPGPPVYRWGGEGSTSPMQQPLEVICMILLAINCILEFRDVVTAFRIMRPHTYFMNGWNWIDNIHFAIMWSGWITWVSYGDRAWKFEMKESYPGVRYASVGSSLVTYNRSLWV